MKYIFAGLLFLGVLSGQTIAEKKALLTQNKTGDLDRDTERFLLEVNRELMENQEALRKLYAEAWTLFQTKADDEQYRLLLDEIRTVRENILALELSWRTAASQSANAEPYALMHQPETTIEELVVDYGSQDYIYMMPDEIAKIKISLGSNLPIPRAAWNQMIEEILTQAGVGIRQINPFLRELYLFKDDKSGIRLITNNPDDLTALPPTARIAFVISPDPSEVRRTFLFLENFSNHTSSTVQLVGRDIILFADVKSVKDLLNLYEFLSLNREEVEYRTVPLLKTKPEEMAKILMAVFNPAGEKENPIVATKKGIKINEKAFNAPQDANSLKVHMLGEGAHGLFLIGTRDELRRAEKIINDVENQVGGARQKVIYWYTAKYSNPDELADVLYRVYLLMVRSGNLIKVGAPKPDLNREIDQIIRNNNVLEDAARIIQEDQLPPVLYPEDSYFEGGFPINPAPVVPANPRAERPRSNRTNFIVDQKTSSIVMVVEADILPEIKELAKRLDVPKKMVHLEVLLFEKRTRKNDDFGLAFLRTGGCATNTRRTCLNFTNPGSAAGIFPLAETPDLTAGIFDFILSRKRSSGIPAFDLIYRFILSQEDVNINANPSVVTVNQVPAFIAIQEEQSINTGIYQVETAKGVTLENAFKRAQYGITIKITPTIHAQGEDTCEPFDSVTLETDVTFDTPVTKTDQPVVIRRNIKNEARVADGETIILGGLRRKDNVDGNNMIPFLGEIPGIGKLFSYSTLEDVSTEMFIFITPKIVEDPSCGFEDIRQQEMHRRPGDIPEFMYCLVEAERREKEALFEHTLTMLLGPKPDRYYSPPWHNPDTCEHPQGEYNGR